MAMRAKSVLFLILVTVFFRQTPIHYLFGALQGDGVGWGLFTLWLCGSLTYFMARSPRAGYLTAALLGVCGAVAYVALARTGAEYDMRLYPLLATTFFGLIVTSQSSRRLTGPALGRATEFFADYSFSLYLVHHTIMYAMWIILPERGTMMFAIAVLASNLTAVSMAGIGEKHHRKIANAMKSKMFLRRTAAVTTP
jgi:peptidoglycan/LPS O-acetylase OafA/YrhL